jgi:NACHT conflict system protein
MAIYDQTRRRAALSLLGLIDVWRLEFGRPGGEPRHPAFEVGRPWPPLDLLTGQ